VSLTFSEYSAKNPTQAGYFRIGHIVFALPPIDIATGRVVNNERLTTLRGRNDMVKKTGQSRWDVTVQWVAILDDGASDEKGRYRQWEDLRSILAMFHAAPFVEIENGYIRQALAELDSSLSTARMGFALRQMRVSTHNDIVNGLDISLTMTLFNYFPYSNDFGYMGAQGQSTDAWLCPAFATYIDQWKAQNLDASQGDGFDGSPILNWMDQIDGTMSFRWRKYTTVKTGTMVSTGVTPAAVAALNTTPNATPTSPTTPSLTGPSATPSAGTTNQSPSTIAALARVAAASASQQTGIPANLIFGQWAFETGGFTNRGARSLNNLGGVRLPGTTTYRTFASVADFGNYYAQLMNSKRYKAAIAAAPKTADGLAQALKSRGYFEAPEPPYAAGIAHYAAQYTNSTSSLFSSVAAPTPTLKPATGSASTPPGPTTANAPGDNLTAAQKQAVMSLIEQGWSYDHAVNDVSFFYQEEEMSLTDSNHGDIPNAYGLFPQQFSILFVNNLAQIPLAGYQYPTYQHIGSTSSKLSIVMSSKGVRDSEEQEPIHSGISVITGASEYLEAQYMRYRNSWRSIKSVHRMQSFYVENKILNMLGIRGLLIDNIMTSPLPNMADTAQVEISGTQYENIFEESTSFQIRSIDAATAPVLQSLVSNGSLSKLSTAEANTVPELAAFAKGRASSSLPTLVPYLLKLGSNSKVSFGTTFDSLANSGATSAQISTIMAALSMSSSGFSTNPSIQTRLTGAASKNLFTVGDVCLVAALMTLNPTATSGGVSMSSQNGFGPAVNFTPSTTTSAFTSANTVTQSLVTSIGSTGIQATYDAMLTLLSGYDSEFAANVNTIANSPTYSSQFTSAVSPSGPGSDAINVGHGAYRDLGLQTLSLNGADFNPGYYFFNHNDAYLAQVRQNLDQVVQASSQASTMVNNGVRPDSYDITITENTYVGANADTNSLVRQTNVPGYDMAEAFPTFKLFLMEDSAPGLMQAFDNFYSYASVLDIEVIKFLDKPDLARIQITNIANILQHKLFDNSLQGRYEHSLTPFFSQTPTSANGVATGGDPTADLITGKTASNQLYQLSGRDMRDGTVPGVVERIPLQYVALLPGTKIQIRLGYSNNPDLLTPVFTGRVTNIEGDDVLTIEAESYLAELCDLPTKDGKAVAGKKYGGWQPWHDSGDVTSVVESLLQMDNAKHFGMFKLATLSDPLITGLTWQNRVGKMIGEYSVSPTNILTQVGAALSSSYDRSGENILINHVINNLGVPIQQRLTRDFYDESTGPFDVYYQFDYKIPDNSTKTIWELIRDISRRYPEYILTTKQYGFPYSADATLVLAHPLDWYFARLPMIGDAEQERASQTMNAEFTQWWTAQGQDAWNTMLAAIKADKAAFFQLNPATPTTPDQFNATLNSLANTVKQFFGVSQATNNETLAYLDQLLQSATNLLDGPSENSKDKAAVAEIVAVRNLWLKYVASQNPTSSDRLKPVRRFHFIDHQTIVHNGMKLNEKIYNAIRVGSTTLQVNNNIPSHYTRVLDVTDLLVDSKTNVEPYTHITRSVAQSFMKEEVGKMYEGEIILRGVPDIEPGDALVILDPSTAIVGIVEVEKTIQSFNQETGFTTICYPRCVTAVNESASANVGRMFSMVMAKSLGNLTGLVQAVSQSGTIAKATEGIGGAATIATVGAGVALVGSPPAWIIESLLGVAMLGGILYAANASETANLIEVMPVTRWGRPWMGGLEGYQISDFWQNIQNSFAEFKADNIYPLIDTYRYFKGAPSNTLPTTTPVAAPATAGQQN
jgi:hypothetical protein